MTTSSLALSDEGTDFALTSPRPLLAGPPAAARADAVVTGAIATGGDELGDARAAGDRDARATVVILDADTVHAPPPGASLYVVAPEALAGPDPVRALERLRRRVAPGLLAGPSSPDGAFDRSPVDVVLMRPEPDPQASARVALAGGVRAAGRPVLVLVDRHVAADCVTAAFDAGAAGAVFACDGGAGDAALLQEVAGNEQRRLDAAPLVTVAVCNHNGARDLEECFASLAHVEYPSFETLLVDDGSSDDSLAVGERFGVRSVALQRVGLGGARNAAIEHARGELIAFLDGDAQAEPAWLARLWRLHDRLRPGGVGGPNLPVRNPGWQERALGGAPGMAMPIVDADGRCTHLAGCNMSFRLDVARAAGFDPEIVYGDDVIFCYRVLDLGEELLLHPTATVRHHRRRSLKGYVKQMNEYGFWSTLVADTHGNRLAGVAAGEPTLLERLDPRRPHPCFVGPQAAQRYNLSFAQLSNGFPFKALTATVAAAGLGAPLAWHAGRLPAWAALATAGVAGQLGYVVARTPVQSAPTGLPAALNRVLTASMWYVGPAALQAGRLRASRKLAERPATP